MLRLKRGTKTARVPLMGISRSISGELAGAIAPFLRHRHLRQGLRAKGVSQVELSWILEDNRPMRHIIESLGAAPLQDLPRVREDALASAAPPDAGKLTALVLAGTRTGGDPLADYAGVSHKALIEIGGTTMIERVVARTALAAPAGRAHRDRDRPTRITGGPARPSARCLRQAWTTMSTQEGPSATVAAALARRKARRCFVTTADHALLQAAWIDEFLAACPPEADVAAALAPRQAVEAAAPATRRTWLRFSDDDFSGCNLFLLARPKAAGVIVFWGEMERLRKEPLRMMQRLGWWFALRYRLGWLRSAAAAERLGALSGGARLALVSMRDGRAAIDVDKAADLDLVRRLVAAEARARAARPPQAVAESFAVCDVVLAPSQLGSQVRTYVRSAGKSSSPHCRPSIEATRMSAPAPARRWIAERYHRPGPSAVRIVRSSSATNSAAPSASKRRKPIDSPLTRSADKVLPMARRRSPSTSDLHVVGVVARFAVDGDRDRCRWRREQTARDLRLEQGVAVEDETGHLQLGTGHPATREVVGQLVEGVEQGAHRHAGRRDALQRLLDEVGAEAGHDDCFADARLHQAAQLPFEHAAAVAQVEQALRELFGQRQQASCLGRRRG